MVFFLKNTIPLPFKKPLIDLEGLDAPPNQNSQTFKFYSPYKNPKKDAPMNIVLPEILSPPSGE